MLSKSMPDRSEPQVGIGLLAEELAGPSGAGRASTRGSLFFAEMSRTTSSLRPRLRGGAGGVGVGPAELVACRCPRARGVQSRRWSVMRAFLSGRAGRLRAGRGAVGRLRDAGGADAVAVGDGGQPLDVACRAAGRTTSVSASHSCGNSCGDVGDRAVVLAELLARPGPGALTRRSGVAVGGERLGQGLGALARGRRRRRPRGSALDARRPGARANADDAPRRRRCSARKRSASAARSSYCWSKRVAAGVGEREDLGRAAAAARAP